MKWGENMRRHILAVGIRDSLRNALERTVPKDKVQIMFLPNTSIAEWLLARHRYAVMIVDLNLFAQAAPGFLSAIRRQDSYVIVLGNAGTKYNWWVEDAANLFLSYQIPLSKLWALIMSALFPGIVSSAGLSGSEQESSKGGAAQS